PHRPSYPSFHPPATPPLRPPFPTRRSPDLTGVHVGDALSPDCARTATQIAADRGSATFAPGDTYSYTCTKANVTSSFTNSATATDPQRTRLNSTHCPTSHATFCCPTNTITK